MLEYQNTIEMSILKRVDNCFGKCDLIHVLIMSFIVFCYYITNLIVCVMLMFKNL